MFIASLPVATQSDPFPKPPHRHYGAAVGGVRLLLQAESAISWVAALMAYRALGGEWPLFLLLFLTPDLFMLGYLANPRLGALIYNSGHTYIVPAMLGFAGYWAALPGLLLLALIWIAHIAFDRMLGYGLKYGVAFMATHLSGIAAPDA